MLSAVYNVNSYRNSDRDDTDNKEDGEYEDALFHSTSSLVYDNKQSIVNEALLDSIIYENTKVKPLNKDKNEEERDDLDGLVKELLNSLDYEFMDDVLITHRGFVSSDTLLRLIMLHLKEAFQQGNELLKVRTFVVLRTWLLKYGEEDFKPSSGRLFLLERELDEIWKTHGHLSDSDRNIMQKLETMVRDMTKPEAQVVQLAKEESKSERSFSDKLRSLFGGKNDGMEEEFIDESTSTTNTTGLSESGKHRAFDVSKVSVEEFAALLTSIDSQYFLRLNWLELVTFPRIVESDLEESLVQRVIDHFNQLCKYLVARLLNTGEERKRLKLLVKYIRTAQYLWEKVRNLNGMMAIVLALQNPAVANLTVWDLLGSREVGVWATLLRLASPLQSFQNLRQSIKNLSNNQNACIPFIGLLLSDLMGLAEAREGASETNEIKFSEWRQVAGKVKEFKALQDSWKSFSSFENDHRINGQKLKNLWNQIYLQPI